MCVCVCVLRYLLSVKKNTLNNIYVTNQNVKYEDINTSSRYQYTEYNSNDYKIKNILPSLATE